MSRKGKSRTYPEKERDSEIEKLRTANRRLKSDNEKLKSELKTYEQAFNENIQFLKGKTKDLSLSELLEGAKKKQKLVDIEKQKEVTYKEFENRWKCKTCLLGTLVLIKIPRQDGLFYIRKCNNPKCKYATRLKKFTEEVEE